MARLKQQGRAQVDEEAIFRAVAEQRALALGAATRSPQARRRLARVSDLLRPSQPAPARVALLSPAERDEDDEAVIGVPRLYPVTRW